MSGRDSCEAARPLETPDKGVGEWGWGWDWGCGAGTGLGAEDVGHGAGAGDVGHGAGLGAWDWTGTGLWRSCGHESGLGS